MQQQPETQVSQTAAWQAARDRALRTTEALIVAEARVVDLEAHVQELEVERSRTLREYEQYKILMERRTAKLKRRAEVAEEGNNDAAEDQEQHADSVGEAVHASPFSD